MFVRVLFLLLLALNLAAGYWLFVAPQPAGSELTAADAGVPKLVLLSEGEHDSVAATVAKTSDSPAVTAPLPSVTKPASSEPNASPIAVPTVPEQCTSLGPFSTQSDMRSVIKTLTPQVTRIQFRESHVTELRGAWVYLPASNNHERALAIARQLSTKGVHDYYVVTAGEQPNAISLGLFHDPANAEKRRSEIAALGFSPKVAQRTDDVTVYFVDYAQTTTPPLDWRTQLPERMDVHAESIACF
jgi:pyruvate/2-oxoglutarate dehydrogenase complex dihydrolipoamide acyltransferase (E2) component